MDDTPSPNKNESNDNHKDRDKEDVNDKDKYLGPDFLLAHFQQIFCTSQMRAKTITNRKTLTSRRKYY